MERTNGRSSCRSAIPLSPSLPDFLSYAVGRWVAPLARQAPTTPLSDRAAFAWRMETPPPLQRPGIIIVRRRATEIGFLHSTVRPSVRPRLSAVGHRDRDAKYAIKWTDGRGRRRGSGRTRKERGACKEKDMGHKKKLSICRPLIFAHTLYKFLACEGVSSQAE